MNTTVQSVSSTLDSKIDSEVSTLESAIASEVSTLNTTIQSVSSTISSDLADEVTRATAAEGAISSLVSEISGNYLDKRTGGTVTGNLDVTGTISAAGGLEISGGGASTSLFVGDGVIGVNTETPSEAFEVVGNGKFSGTVLVATPTLSGHAANKGYVDTAVANLVNGAPELLNTLNELASAINDDESFAATIATNIGNVSTALVSVSSTLDSKINSEVSTLNSTVQSVSSTLNSKIDSEVSTLESTVASVSASLDFKIDSEVLALETTMASVSASIDSKIDSEVLTLETTVASVSATLDSKIDTQISSLSSTVDANFVEKVESDAVTLNGGLTVSSGLSANLIVVSGNVTVAEPTIGSHAVTKNYVDYMISIIDGGSF